MKRKIGRKRVLMLVENNGIPDDIRVLHEAMALTEAGYLVSIICQSTPNRPMREILGGIHIFRYPMTISGKGLMTYLWEYIFSLLSMFALSIIVLLKPGFDYVHAANPPDIAVFIAAVYKMIGKRFIFDHHDLSPEMYQLRFGTDKKIHVLIHKILIVLEKLSCTFADHVITTNQSYKAIEMKRDGVSADHITIVRNGPDSTCIHPVQPDPELSGRAKIIFAYLGEMAEQDGVDHLLHALHYLDQRFNYHDWFCVLIGPANEELGLQRLATELGLANRIWFTGHVPQERWISLLSAADICVEPAPANPLNEASTMVKLMDYMAMVKPSVAYDLRENRITAGNAALYAQPNDEVDLAYQFVKLIDNPDLRFRLGEIGRQRIVDQLDWKYQKDRLISLYRLMEQNKRKDLY